MPQDEPREEVTENQFRIIKARLGIEAESFQNSHVGRYIYDRIDMDLEKIRQLLEDTDPHEIDKCVAIRNDIQVRKLFDLWLKEAIRSGLAAETEIHESETSVY